jgi:hypothetical protein
MMQTKISATMLALALLGGVTVTAAQQAPSGNMQAPSGTPQAPSGNTQEKLNLSQSKEQKVTQGLSKEPAQTAPGYRGDVGSAPPASLAQKQLPGDVTDDVPETKTFLFIKLPDRILLIDPQSRQVAEIVGGPQTTGSTPDSPGMPQR